MRLDDLVPYAGNPRGNDKAVDGVAASIRELGFRGAIVCDREHEGGTSEHPVIVNGHTRVKALKKLGYGEIPDEWVVYTDGLAEGEVKALRLADNRTAEAATWNRTLLQHEVRSIKSLEMGRFGFDFKSKHLPYGAERLRTDDAYNLGLVNTDDCDADGMPRLAAVDARPERLIGFNYAKTATDKACGVHFFVDDYQFKRAWNKPRAYFDLLAGFECVLTPDFSLYMDMPMQRWNVYRSRACGCMWQRQGVTVVPALSWSAPKSYGFCFDGLEPGGTYAVSTVGVKRDEGAMAVWRDGMAEDMRRLEPRRILLYGGGRRLRLRRARGDRVRQRRDREDSRWAVGAYAAKARRLAGGCSLTDRQLTSEIDRLGKVMEETAQAHVAYLQRRGGSKADSERYRKAQARYSELQNESMRRMQAKAVRNVATSTTRSKPTHTFVNGFGEATSRYVTTGTYESALKRTESEVRGVLVKALADGRTCRFERNEQIRLQRRNCS